MLEHEGEALAKKAGSDALHYGEKAVESYIRKNKNWFNFWLLLFLILYIYCLFFKIFTILFYNIIL